MPIIQIALVEGRDAAVVKRFAKKMALTAHEELGAPLATIRVIVTQLPSTHWAVGDRTRDEIDAENRSPAAEVTQ